MSATCTEDVSKQHYERTPIGPRGVRYFSVIANGVGDAFAALGRANPPADYFVDRSGYVPQPVIAATNWRIVKQTPAGAQRSGYFEIEVSYGQVGAGGGGKKEPVPNGPAVVTKRVRRTSQQTDVSLKDRRKSFFFPGNLRPLLTTNKKPILATRDLIEHELLIHWVQKGFNSLDYTHLLDTINSTRFGLVVDFLGKLDSIEDDERTDGYLDCSVVVLLRGSPRDWELRALDDDGVTVIDPVFEMYQTVDWSALQIPGFNAPTP